MTKKKTKVRIYFGDSPEDEIALEYINLLHKSSNAYKEMSLGRFMKQVVTDLAISIWEDQVQKQLKEREDANVPVGVQEVQAPNAEAEQDLGDGDTPEQG